MRALHGTVLAAAMAAFSAHGAVDPLAGSPEGERVMLWPE